jgi:hypothetical protein
MAAARLQLSLNDLLAVKARARRVAPLRTVWVWAIEDRLLGTGSN